MSNDWYVIVDMESFISTARKIVFNTFGSTEEDSEFDNALTNSFEEISKESEEELDKILSQEESTVIAKSLMKKQKNIKTNEYRYLVSDEAMISIIESLNERMVSNIINSLVNKGLVETAYDEESNDFVFWIKEDEQDITKPETD